MGVLKWSRVISFMDYYRDLSTLVLRKQYTKMKS